MSEITHINNTNNFGCSGVYYLYSPNASGRLSIPSGTDAPTQTTSGELFFVAPSSLLLVGSGVGWAGFQASGEVAAPAFSPSDISHLMFWYDAEAQGGTSGSTVAQLTDQGPSGNDATQSVASERATYRDGGAGINNLAVWDFDGTDDNYDISGTTDVKDFTLFAVYNADAFNNRTIIGIDNFDGGSYGYSNTAFSSLRFDGAFEALNTTVDWATNTDHIDTVARDTVGDNLDSYKDGSSSSNASANSAGTAGIEITNIGIDGDAAGREWDGRFAEIIFYAKLLDSTERGDVHTYLTDKYGI